MSSRKSNREKEKKRKGQESDSEDEKETKQEQKKNRKSQSSETSGAILSEEKQRPFIGTSTEEKEKQGQGLIPSDNNNNNNNNSGNVTTATDNILKFMITQSDQQQQQHRTEKIDLQTDSFFPRFFGSSTTTESPKSKNSKTNENSMQIDPERPLNLYVCTDHSTLKPLRPASIIFSQSQEQAIELLDRELIRCSYHAYKQQKYSLVQLSRFSKGVYFLTMENIFEQTSKDLATEQLEIFVSINHPCIAPYGPATVIVASNHNEAKRLLDDGLKKKELLKESGHEDYTVFQQKSNEPMAHILYHGDLRI